MSGRRFGRIALDLAAIAVLGVTISWGVVPADAAPAPIRGGGSSYVGLAMQQWTADAATSGLQVNYTPSGSPQGLSQFATGTTDFAGTEAEFASLSSGGNTDPLRGFQYVPDVAGAVAVMYNIEDKAGRKVDYLHLSRLTVAKIFLGEIANWSDPAIRDDNRSPALPDGLLLPDQAIHVVYRNGSGTTALFYDFVENIDPAGFNAFAARNQLRSRPTDLVNNAGQPVIPGSLLASSSDQAAQLIANPSGKWSIGYDEFGFALQYKVPAAWVQNENGESVKPYAQNISTALEDAHLRPDLSQELSGVYTSRRPGAYPISAYSYVVTQCVATADRPTCKGAYINAGVGETLAKWLRYVACDGQVNMARIGYSPLPPNLSQEVANSVGRLQGSTPEQLNPGNCNNPRFRGSLGLGSTSPPDPLNKPRSAGAGGAGAGPGQGAKTGKGSGAGGAGGSGPGAGPGSAGSDTTAATSSSENAADQSAALNRSAGGGSAADRWRDPAPVEYRRAAGTWPTIWPLAMLLAILVIPVIIAIVNRSRARSTARR
jgi:phosphate transport system substrate-binding protein